MLQQIQTGTRHYIPGRIPRQFLNQVNTTVNNQTVSIIGNAIWGLPMVPQSFKDFKINNPQDINRLNDFETNLQSFQQNHKKYQGNILPYITGYSVLQNNGQINFTRLTGINLPDFPNLKPGFSLDNTHKIYLMTISLIPNQNFKNYWNYNNLSTQSYYSAIIITKNCDNITIVKNDNNFKLTLTPNQNDKFTDTLNPESQDFQQRKIFVNDKPSKHVLFNFNVNNIELFWKNVLNTNIQRLDEFGYAIMHYQDVFNKINWEEYQTNITINLTEFNHSNFKTFTDPSQTAETPWIVSQGFYDLSQNLNRNEDGLKLEDRVIKLFKIHACCPGELGNNIVIKIIPISLTDNEGWARFHLHLIDKNTENTLYEFNNLDLNPDSQDYIGRVIGTELISLDYATNKTTSSFKEYPRQNPWIRVELSDAVINKTILQETIPSGYLGSPKIKNNLNNNSYQVLNNSYTISPQFNFNDSSSFDTKLKLQNTHAWGKNLKNVFNRNIKNEKKKDFKRQTIIKSQTDNLSTVRLLEYKRIPLNLNRQIEEKRYLNTFFYDINNDNFEDMFHLEKILLLNEYDSQVNKLRQFWNYAKYIQTGDNVTNLINNPNFNIELFSNVTDLENIFYYFTINNKSMISQSDIIGLDSIEEALQFDGDNNILSFNIEMLGGCDGLNVLDINEYSINDKGLNQSEYLRKLYKKALDVIFEKVNGQNEIIYLPEIFNREVIDYALSLITGKRSLLILDKPFCSSNNSIIYSKDFLTLDAGFNNVEYYWYQQKYKYINNQNINNLDFDFIKTIDTWKTFTPQISNVISFANYFETKTFASATSQININFNNTFILPTGLFAVSTLIFQDSIQRKMNPLHNVTLRGLGEFKIYSIIENSLDIHHPNLLKNIELINNLNINLIDAKIQNGETKYSFASDKTTAFDVGAVNNNVLTKINARNVLNDIKEKIELASYSFLFESILSKNNMLTRINLSYTLVLTQFLNKGLIKNFKIKLDADSTSDTDLAMGLIRGAIYIEFNNQEIVQIPV